MTTIGVITPASAVDERALAESAAVWEQAGYTVKKAAHLYEKHRFLAASDVDRAADVMAMFCDKDVDIVMAAGGGYGATRLLGLLDYETLAKNKKPFVGLSDTTALQLALWQKAGIVSLTGYVMKPRNGRVIFPYTQLSLDDCLAGREQSFSGLESNGSFARIKGRLIGGCLTLVTSLIGTPYFPDDSEMILVLEDVGEEPYHVDRMLSQLENAGVFARVKAVVFGQFMNCKAKDPTDGTIDDVLAEWKDRIKVPVFWNFPYGHQAGSAVWPVGGRAAIESNTLCILKDDENG